MIGRSRFPSGLTAFLLVALVIAAKNPVALTRAEFWAEDSSEFFVGALTMGARSLWVPVWGYSFFVSRLIAWIATWFPVLWAPYFYAGCSLVLGAMAMSYFVRDGFAWLVPSRVQRLAICLVVSIGPGTGEVFLNLSILPAVLTFWGLLLLLEEPHRLDTGRLLLLLVLALSAGHAVLLAPLVLVLWRLTRRRQYLILLALLVAVAGFNWAGTQQTTSEAGVLAWENAGDVPRILLENALLRFFVGPFLGPIATGRFMTLPAALFWPSLLAISAVFVVVLRASGPQGTKVLLLSASYVSAVGVFAVVAVTRSYNFARIQRESGVLLWEHRYSFLPGAVALLIWLSICFMYCRHRRWRPAAYAGIALLSLHNLSQWNRVYGRSNLHWPERAAAIQELLDLKSRGELREPRRLRVPAHPLGWNKQGESW